MVAEAAAQTDRGRDDDSSSDKQTHWLVPHFFLSILRMTISAFDGKCCDVLATVWRKVIHEIAGAELRKTARFGGFPPVPRGAGQGKIASIA